MDVPHFINDDKSEMRGIKSGWYAIDEDGNLVFGPFDTYEECVEFWGTDTRQCEPMKQ